MPRSIPALFLFAVSCAVFVVPAWAQGGKTLHVSPTGNDGGSGTATQPFASIERARDEIHNLKQAGPLPAGGVTVVLHRGIYCLTKTFKLGPEDSGTAEAPIVYRGAENEQVVLIGGKLVTGFVADQGQIVKADLASQGLKGVSFKQLFFDGNRQHLARYPNYDPQNPYGGGWAYADGKPVPMYQEVPGETRRTFQYKTADARNWSRPQEAEVMVFPRYNWWNNIVAVASIDRDTRTITLARDCSYPVRPGDRYYVRNVREELDSPGEWYLDVSTSTLYFWPPVPLAGKPVYVPTLRTIAELGAGTAYVTLRNLTIECCEGTAIMLKDTHDCLVASCTIRNVGDYNGSGVSIGGGHRNGVVGCNIYEIGSSGVAINGGDRKTLTPAENYADNNYIHHVGVFYKQGVGVGLHGVGNRASHNLIHDGPRMGIMFGGNNLVIEYNHIRHVNLETSDTGAVYTGGRDWISSRGTQVRYNYFHDILGYGQEKGKWVSPHFAWGVYLDDNTGGVDVVGNIVARCVRGLVHLHNGRDNHVENNILVDGKLQQIECNGWTDTHRYWIKHLPSMIKGYESVADQPAWKGMRHMDLHPTKAVLPDHTIMAGNVFQRNILCYRGEESKLYRFNRMSLDHNRADYNLVYHFGLPIMTNNIVKAKNTVGPNLAPNAGFEEGTAGQLPRSWQWQIRPQGKAVAVMTTKGARTDKAALRIDGCTATDRQGRPEFPIVRSVDIAAKPGQMYKLTAWMRAQTPDTKAGLGAQAWKRDVYSWASTTKVTISTEWKEYEWVFKFPAEKDRGYHPQMKAFYLRFDLGQPTGSLWIDDVCVKEAVVQSEWDSWREQHQDEHSIVADPLFIDPQHDDYRLRPESPAFKLGFHPIPVEKIGPYADPLRATWPIVEAEGAREKPLVSEQ
jgi:hypothetical protein